MSLYRLLSRFYPKNVRESYINLLRYIGIKVNADTYVGFTVFIGLLLGIAAAFITNTYFDKVHVLLLWLGYFILIETLIYVPIMLKVDSNAKKVEQVLPDALQLMSSNLKSGLTIDQALLASARPEFGIFEKEINTIGKEIAIGKPTERALMDSTTRISSEKYKKTMELIASGLRSGGELAKLLDQTSFNLKHQKLVDEKVRSNVMMYVIFIFAAVAIGAPVLYGLSSFLVEVLTQIFGSVDIPENLPTQGLSLPVISLGNIGITKEFIMTYIITSLVISSVMGGLIVGLIAKGKEKYGFRYVPILIVASITVFIVVRLIIRSLLGDLLAI